ncbi:hypothetical protein JKG47_00905 [Acidithiobacillus sp. MC6.1]|nr:hypothetical protein [Acidithiobacillus sp. MC6.1]
MTYSRQCAGDLRHEVTVGHTRAGMSAFVENKAETDPATIIVHARSLASTFPENDKNRRRLLYLADRLEAIEAEIKWFRLAKEEANAATVNK